jgi:cysteine-rich repeat protein
MASDLTAAFSLAYTIPMLSRFALLPCLALTLAGCFGDDVARLSPGVCGDGSKNAGEDCDDGNTVSGDGCSAICVIESGGAVCGNNVKEGNEQCDDGNTVNGDGCSSTCRNETSSACTVSPNSGCPTGQTCDVARNGSHFCRSFGTGVAETACSNSEVCASGYSCVAEGTSKFCRRHCGVDSDCNGTGARCKATLNDAGGQPIAGIKLCTFTCNPILQTGCPTTLSCYAIGNLALDYTDCALPGTTPEQSSCSERTQCVAGSVCDSTVDGLVCVPYCDRGNVTACPGGQLCFQLTEALSIGGVSIGGCH